MFEICCGRIMFCILITSEGEISYIACLNGNVYFARAARSRGKLCCAVDTLEGRCFPLVSGSKISTVVRKRWNCSFHVDLKSVIKFHRQCIPPTCSFILLRSRYYLSAICLGVFMFCLHSTSNYYEVFISISKRGEIMAPEGIGVAWLPPFENS